ncbi:MAG: hypothetical protein ABR936_09035 [Bacteroidota bacterium]|jgi:hypothetical protein
MNVSSFVLEQALKQLGISTDAIHQLQLAGQLSDVDGSGFPTELFQLSAPMVTRGLLNYAVLQMKRDWLYPYWVHQQLDPKSESFVARSQNPLLLNITHRNWTLLGSPSGLHEAIVDPRGLVTPLPREWSIDVWLVIERGICLPSLSTPICQEYDTQVPRITTRFDASGMLLELEAFVDTTNRGRDVLFQAVHVTNNTDQTLDALVCFAVRPFNPEGVAPIQHIEFKYARQLYVDHCLGLVFAEEPQRVYCSNAQRGDVVNILRRQIERGNSPEETDLKHSVTCPNGLANAVVVFEVRLDPNAKRSIHSSVALGTKQDLLRLQSKSTWRVSFEKRRERHHARWEKERSTGAVIELADERLQKLFDANVLALLQLQDGEFISPGPYLYHHFWFRDAAPMVHALDRLGFHRRARQVIDSFPERQTSDGFFRGPDGEWDSNGEVLWLIEQHAALSRSISWLKQVFPHIQRGTEWIIQKRKQSRDTVTTHKGLLPPSLSAEHFGTVDQYYWDSFWGLRGIHSAAALARIIHRQEIAERWDREAEIFSKDIRRSLEVTAGRLGRNLIPASPSRPFDESAIGFVSGIYPLGITNIFPSAFHATLHEFTNRYVDDRGFFHPIIHSGYNPYLTLQIAHAFLFYTQSQRAWQIAEAIFHQCRSPYSLPEAIHPKTGGGAMGDGHHGWAAAEIILFLLDCLVREEGATLSFFKGATAEMIFWGKNISFKGIATSFGKVGCTLNYETEGKAICSLSLDSISEKKPKAVELYLPFSIKRVLTSTQGVDLQNTPEQEKTKITCSSGSAVLLLER